MEKSNIRLFNLVKGSSSFRLVHPRDQGIMNAVEFTHETAPQTVNLFYGRKGDGHRFRLL